ncbi:MAG: S41 family peptidase [Candidatus Tectimicrobiota bacterium]
MHTMRRFIRVLLILGLVLGWGRASQAQTSELPASSPSAEATSLENGLKILDEILQRLREHFYDPTLRHLDWTALRDKYRPLLAAASPAAHSAVLNRLLAELAASHTRHYTRDEPAYYQLLDIFSGALRRDVRRFFPDGQVSYPGIGVFTQHSAEKTFVSGILGGLPAATAGLQVGDEILTVNGQPYHPIQSFTGHLHEEVTLQVRRRPEAPPLDIRVVPQQLRPNEAFLTAMQESARVILADGVHIGYIHIWSYAGSQYQRLLEHEIGSGKLKEADALILDLRDGWGGAQAHYLDLFQARGPTVTLTDRDGKVSLNNVKWRKPVVMLINGGTRSGKEILAYGFKKYGLGELIGTQTAGAVLAGRAFLLSDGSLLLLAVTDVHVDGQRLEGVGVTPTIEVPFPVEYAEGKDPQLERAIEVLSRAVRG